MPTKSKKSAPKSAPENALKSTDPSPAMGDRIYAAFEVSDHFVDDAADDVIDYDVFFEHGQWWVREIVSGATWAVVDAVGGDAIDGFSFEPL